MARILRGYIYWANLNPTIGNEQAELYQSSAPQDVCGWLPLSLNETALR